MGPEEMKLEELTASQLIRGHLPREWVIDYSYLRHLDPKIAVQVVGLRFNFLAEEAKLNAKILEVEAKMYGDIAKVVMGKPMR